VVVATCAMRVSGVRVPGVRVLGVRVPVMSVPLVMRIVTHVLTHGPTIDRPGRSCV
jgi:hypothetical protein